MTTAQDIRLNDINYRIYRQEMEKKDRKALEIDKKKLQEQKAIIEAEINEINKKLKQNKNKMFNNNLVLNNQKLRGIEE